MYDKGLAERLTERVGDMFEMEVTYTFGGFGYLMNGNICVAIWNDMLVIRVGVDAANALMNEPHIRPFDLTGRPMKGWMMVTHDGIAEDTDLRRYVDLAVFFSPVVYHPRQKPKNPASPEKRPEKRNVNRIY